MKKLIRLGAIAALLLSFLPALPGQTPSLVFSFDFSGANPDQPTLVGAGWTVSAMQLTGNGVSITNAGIQLLSSEWLALPWDPMVDPVNPNTTEFVEFSITNLTGVTQTLQTLDFLGSAPPLPEYTGNWHFYLESDVNPITEFVASAVSIPPTIMPLQLYSPPWADYKVSHGETMTFTLRTTNSGSGGHDVFLEFFEITAIPEPGTFAFVGGLVALGFLFFRRRIQK